MNYDGASLGPLKWNGDTALQFRRDLLKPFFDQYLKDAAPRADTPPVFIYNTGENHWDRLPSWPLSCDRGCASKSRPLYLTAGFGLSFTSAATGDSKAAFDEYVSDPAKPVPYVPRPVRFADSDAWRRWLVTDQRGVADRPDVLAYVTSPLTEPLRISGAPTVNLVASTSGTDSDWVVKLIDVYPDEVPGQPEMGGYQLGVSMDIFRGRYRESFETPKAIASNKPLPYKFILPTANHVPAGASDHGAGPVQLVPALRSQPADVRAEYLLREAGGICEGDPEGLSLGGGRQLHRSAGGFGAVEHDDRA